LTAIDNAADALTSPVALTVAEREAKTLVERELMTAVASVDNPLDNVLRAVCRP
jgi:hypothetical protein